MLSRQDLMMKACFARHVLRPVLRLTIVHAGKSPRWQNCMGIALHGRSSDVAFSKPIAACVKRELCGYAARARVLHKASARTAHRYCAV